MLCTVINYIFINILDAELLYQQLKREGTLWFTDLTLPDAIIPFLLATVNLLLIEVIFFFFI